MDAPHATRLSRSVPARQSLTTPAAKANWRKLHFFPQMTPARTCSSVAQINADTIARRCGTFSRSLAVVTVWHGNNAFIDKTKVIITSVIPPKFLKTNADWQKMQMVMYTRCYISLAALRSRGGACFPRGFILRDTTPGQKRFGERWSREPSEQKRADSDCAHHVFVVLYRRRICTRRDLSSVPRPRGTGVFRPLNPHKAGLEFPPNCLRLVSTSQR